MYVMRRTSLFLDDDLIKRMQKLIAHLQQEGVDCSDAKATADRFDPAQLTRLLD